MTEDNKTNVRCRYCGRYLSGITQCPDCTSDRMGKQKSMWEKKRKSEKKRKKYFYDTIEKENEDWHNNKNPLVRLFYKMKFDIAIKYADLQIGDAVLDFGCGDGWLKKYLDNCEDIGIRFTDPRYNIIGYDIDPKLTEIKDYTKVKPDKIFALDVFEHISKTQIRKIIRNFKKMNPQVVLITIIPTETWLWRKTRKLVGLSETVADHITKLKEILKILEEEMVLEKKINFLTFSHISKWKARF